MKTHITGPQYAQVARVYHHHLRVKLRDPVWNSFWWDMFEWAQRCRRSYQDSLVNYPALKGGACKEDGE